MSATPAQLTAYGQQLATLTTRAQALGPGLAAGSTEARRLSGVLLGLQGTSGQVSAALNALAQGPRPVNDPAFLRQLRIEISSVNNQIATARNNFIQLDGAATPKQIRELVKQMTDLKTKANDLARGLPQGSEELRKLSLAAATAERTIAGATGQMSRLGLASQVKLGVTSSLNDFRSQFLGATSGIQNFAKFTDAARVATVLYEAQLRRQNLTLDEGAKHVTKLSDTLKILPSQAQDAIQVLLRNGFNLDQSVDALQRVGASAVARGRTAADGVDLFAQAIQSQSSTLLNYVGVAGNLSDFYVSYAKSIGTVANKLDIQQKAQAAVNLVTKETNEELANLPILQASLSGGFSDLAISYQTFEKTIGKSFTAPVAEVVSGLNSAIGFFSKLPTVVQDGTGKIVIFGAAALVAAKLLLFGVQNVYAFRTQILGITPAAAAANGGLSIFGIGIGIFRKSIQGAVAEVGALKLAVLGLVALPAAAITGYSIGRQIGTLDTGKGTVDQNIQYDILTREKILQRMLGISSSESDAVARQLADDIDGITAKAERQVADAQAKGGTRYASQTFALQNAQRNRLQALRDAASASERGDDAGVAAAEKIIATTNQQIRLLNAAREATLKKKAATHADEESTVAQDEAYDKLNGSLADLSTQFGSVKTTEFQGQLVSAQKAFDTFQASITKGLKNGDITKKQGSALQASFKEATANIIPDLVQRQLDTNKETALAGQRDLEQARIALIKDARSKREHELTLETERIGDEYKKRIDDAKQNAGARGLSSDQQKSLNAEAVRLEGERDEKIKLARQTANKELFDLERDEQNKVLDAQKASFQEQINVISAGTAALEQRRDAALGRTSDPSRQLGIERQFSGQILDLKKQEIQANRQLSENAAARQLADDLRAAEDAGAHRLALEAEARTRYGNSIRAIELGSQTQTNQAILDSQNRQNEDLARVYQRGADKILLTIKNLEGAELLSLKHRLEARLALAVTSGNAPLQQNIQGTLDSVTAQMLQNVTDFRNRLRESRQGAVDLQAKLDDVARTPLQKAESSAASPFNDVIKSARKDLGDLDAAYRKISAPTGAQAAAYRSQQATSTTIITRANAERNQAVLTADQAFYRERDDKSMDAAAKLGKTQFDGFKISEGDYDKLLDANRKYWLQRLRVAVKGSADEDAVRQHLADNQAERDRARQVTQSRKDDNVQLARDELETSLALAKTDTDRNRIRRQLLVTDEQHLVSLGSQITALRATGGTEEEINKLVSKRETLQKNVNQARQEERDRVKELLASQLALTEAEHARQAAMAISSGTVQASKNQAVKDAQAELASLQRQITQAGTNGLTDAQKNELLTQYANKQTDLFQKQRDAARYPLEVAQQQLDVDHARVEAQAKLTGLSRDAVFSAEQALKTTRDDIAAVQAQLAQRGVGRLTDQEASAAKVKLFGLIGQQADQEAALAQARVDQSNQLINLDEAHNKVLVAGTAERERGLLSAQLDVGISEQRLVAAQEALAAAKGVTEQTAQRINVENARADLASKREAAEKAAVSYVLDQSSQALALDEARSKVLEARTPLENRALVTAQQEVLNSQDALTVAQQALELSKGKADESTRRAAVESATADLLTKQEALTTARVQQQVAAMQLGLDLSQARQLAEAKITGLAEDAVASAGLDLDITRQKLDLNLQEQAALMQRSHTEAELGGLQKTQVDLLGQQAEQQRKLADAERARLDLQRALAISSAQLQLEAVNTTGSSRAAADLLLAQIKTQEAAQQLLQAQQAITASGRTTTNLERLKTAQDGLTSAIADQRSKADALTSSLRETRDAQEGVAESGLQLTRSLEGGTPSARAYSDAVDGVRVARLKVAEATRAFLEAQSDLDRAENPTTLKAFQSAQDALTGSIQGQRTAVEGLASAYETQLSNMDAVRDAADKLGKVLNPDAGSTKIDNARELDRFLAIEQRRNGAIQAVQAALQSGDNKRIADATNELAAQEERYRKQGDLLKKNQVQVALTNEQAVQDLYNRLDRLGITFDTNATALAEKARIAQQEAETAQSIQTSQTIFKAATENYSVTTHGLLDGLNSGASLLHDVLTDAFTTGAKKLAGAVGQSTVPMGAGVKTYTIDGRTFGSLEEATAYHQSLYRGGAAGSLTPALLTVPMLQEAIARVTQAASRPVSATTTTSNAVGATVNNITRGGDTYYIDIPITVDGQPVPTPAEFEQIAQGVLDKALGEVRRQKAWNKGEC
ncbi:hypothetical protein [Deinococcus ruber]|uniref:hypothetical protein n=1 Tax=Deinococcus ruber TaxID=1848197 RepID=UPI00166CABDB|nr:hypothetical protein [Deinococcus ruber]